MMPAVERFMTRTPYALARNDTLARARELLDRHAIRHLPVLEGSELCGVIVERELAAIEAIRGIRPGAIPVAQAMRPAISVSRNLTLDNAIELMLEHGTDCVVVCDARGAIEGIFTAVDALDALRASPSYSSWLDDFDRRLAPSRGDHDG
jgi:CBS domain-containing protein